MSNTQTNSPFIAIAFALVQIGSSRLAASQLFHCDTFPLSLFPWRPSLLSRAFSHAVCFRCNSHFCHETLNCIKITQSNVACPTLVSSNKNGIFSGTCILKVEQTDMAKTSSPIIFQQINIFLGWYYRQCTSVHRQSAFARIIVGAFFFRAVRAFFQYCCRYRVSQS